MDLSELNDIGQWRGFTYRVYMWHMVIPVLFWNGLLAAIVHGLLWRKDEQQDYIW